MTPRKPRRPPPPSADCAARCCICQEPIPANEMAVAWQQVIGYAVPRGGGGANFVALKKPTGQYCHPICGKTFGQHDQPSML